MSFRINRVYTRSGDKGETGLVGGKRVLKTSERISAYGDLDELNAVIGLVRSALDEKTRRLDAVLEKIQQEIFDVGAELATPVVSRPKEMWVVLAEHVKKLEELCDSFSEGLPELTSFVLPGGSRLVALLHLARTVCRRAERSVLFFAQKEAGEVRPEALQYVNRLSDAFFIFARWAVSADGGKEVLWVPGNKR